MEKMMEIAENYPYVAIDTEFPGVVAKPTGPFRSAKEYNYHTVKCNVDLLKVIQIGFTFYDSSGSRPEGVSTWQFNFSFDLVQDLYAQESIEFLRHSGINFERHVKEGIAVNTFAEVLMSSGIVLSDEIHWISFHGSYDFAYLLKILTCQLLPDDEEAFFDLLHTYFPSLYDVKFLLRGASEELQRIAGGSLNKIADFLGVVRLGSDHQAGSDSYVTGLSFFKLIEKYFGNQVDDSKYSGVLYGLGDGAVDGAETIELLAPQGNQNLVEVPTMPQQQQHVPDVAVQMHGYGGNNHWGAPHAAAQARGGGGGGGWGNDRHSGMQNGYSNGSHRPHNGYQNGYYPHMNGHNGQYKHH
jgi:CCR4-NOT transcription complex subunit 7/8